MINTTVNILGTKYKIVFKDIGDVDYDGLCDSLSKVITIRNDNVNNVSDFDALQKLDLRHEIIHAFMFECGLGFNWEHKPIGHEETTVDWFAYQAPNIYKVYAQLDIL